ncbi:STELLO glycosyltransferase family protein [Bacteroidota bacterium]
MSTSRSLIITTIAPPNRVLENYAEECKRHDIDFIIAGDRKSPTNFSLPGSDFWSINRQMGSGFKSAHAIPENHYSRKNIAYLAAIERGHGIIMETDDDNLPYESFWRMPESGHEGQQVLSKGWINVFSLFTDDVIWPRGFPLEQIGEGNIEAGPTEKYYCPIQQGLADDNPDVDAVFRLTRDLPLKLEGGLSYVLGKGSWCPFNSQNTVWFKEAFPLLYLPSKCSFRMTDIWRSFVAQRIAWEYGWNIAFYSPTVSQERNEHNLLKDLEDEVPGYLNNSAIGKALEELDLSDKPDDIYKNLINCYKKLIAMNLVGSEEIDILTHWINDLQGVL